MDTTARRHFLKTSALAATGAVFLGACKKNEPSSDDSAAPAVVTGKKYSWKMVTTWPPHFPVLGEGAEWIAKRVEELSQGQMRIQVYGANELVPAMQTFEAVSQGSAEMGHGAAYYWLGKIPGAPFFTSVPFGMNAQQMNAWIFEGGGLGLWESLYESFNLIPMPAGNTGVQMGGWFNRPINSLEDIKGLKMRIPGLGGKVISEAGGSAVLSAGGEIFTNLERGVIDATEWVGPYHDYLMGFHKVSKHYHYPGWQEPGSVMELIVNRTKFESLPLHLKQVIRTAATEVNAAMLSRFEAENYKYLELLQAEHGVKVLPFPDDVLAQFQTISLGVLDELSSKDAQARKIYASFRDFEKKVGHWARVSEFAIQKLKYA